MFILSKLGRLSIAVLVVTGVALPAAPVNAAKTICVGLVVDARSLDGPTSAKCTTVPDGSTGYDVLRAGGHTVGFRNDGIICTIDNRPSDGCAATDALHYWAYFHREKGSSSWSYSNEGASTYEPENGETEGWVWRDGDMAKPDNVPYATICPQTAAPTPRPSATHVSTSPSATVRATSSPSATAQPAKHHTRRKQHHATPATAAPTMTPTSAATSSPPVTIATANSEPSDGSGPPWGVIVGAVVVVGLGGSAALRWRRRGVE